MARLEYLKVTMPADELLRAIWYADGSGAGAGVPISDIPDEYRIQQIDIDGSVVTIELTRPINPRGA